MSMSNYKISVNKYMRILSSGKVYRRRHIILTSRSLGLTTMLYAVQKYFMENYV